MNELDIKKIRKSLGLTQVEMAKKLGVDTKTVQNWEYGKPIPASKHGIIRSLMIDPQTYYGGGSDSPSSTTAPPSGLPLITVDAIAGFPSDNDTGVLVHDCDTYNIPEFAAKGAQYLIRVSGSSMYPKYSNGDILACRKVESVTFFQWGKVYVLDTCQGALVKRLYEDKTNADNVICHSDNSDNYPDFTLPKSEIRTLSIVVGVIRME